MNAPASDLTFSELRLATMTRRSLASPGTPDSGLTQGIDRAMAALDAPEGFPKERLTQALAGMVLQADRIALAHGIDLAQAIRDRLAPENLYKHDTPPPGTKEKNP